MMLIFQMRDRAGVEAFVLARDEGRAAEIFKEHLRMHGGFPSLILYHEVQLQDLDEPMNDAVYEALELEREGLVLIDAQQWVFLDAGPEGDRAG